MNSSCLPQSRWDACGFCHFSPVRLPVNSFLCISPYIRYLFYPFTTFPSTFPRAFRYEFKMRCLFRPFWVRSLWCLSYLPWSINPCVRRCGLPLHFVLVFFCTSSIVGYSISPFCVVVRFTFYIRFASPK